MGNVKNLCQYCICPTQECDQPNVLCALKSKPYVAKLVRKKKLKELQATLQHCVKNAFYSVWFGCHNTQGTHGACPMEMLHALLLGIFKYVKECMFDCLGGNDSQVCQEFDGLASVCGDLTSRQSNPDMPCTVFSGGLNSGRMQAKEHTGILLLIATLFRITGGWLILQRCDYFKKETHIKDWSLLIETLLQWEMWLKSDKLKRLDLDHTRQKHR